MKSNIKSYSIHWQITLEDTQDSLKLELSYLKEGLSKLAEALQAREDSLLVKDMETNSKVINYEYDQNV